MYHHGLLQEGVDANLLIALIRHVFAGLKRPRGGGGGGQDSEVPGKALGIEVKKS